MTIKVTEVDEAPDVSGDGCSVSLQRTEDITTALDTYTADDPEEDSANPTLALAGADRGKFDFDTTNGDLRFKAAPERRARLREAG